MMPLTLVVLAWTVWVKPNAVPFSGVLPSTPEEIAYWEEYDRIMAGGPHHLPLRIMKDAPGVDQPLLKELASLDLPDSTPVIGTRLHGKAYAFVIDAMAPIDHHILNLNSGNVSFSVTYCNLVDCVRVIKAKSSTLNPLRLGGLDKNNQLVLLLNGVRYGQESPALPLQDHAFTRTSLGDWGTLHPATKVYVGG